MIAIFTAALFAWLAGYFLLHGFGRVSFNWVSIQLSIAVCLGLAVVASANFHTGLFAQKPASEFAFEIFTGASSQPTFLLQFLLNAPAFALLGAWWAAIGTNCALVALTFLYVHNRDSSAAWVLLAPSCVNFALFALRDPIIGVLMFVFTLLAMQPRWRPTTFAGIGVVAVGMALTRPENLLLFVAALVIIAWQRTSNTGFRVVALPALGAGFLAALRFGPALLGIRVAFSITNAPLVLAQFYRLRANRNTLDAGGASNILRGVLPNLPFPVRYPLQLFTAVVLPLPFEIRSLTLLLAFGDSLVLMWVARRWWPRAPSAARTVALVYLFAIALFSSNYGNTFRLRMPLYFIMAAGLLGAGDDDADASGTNVDHAGLAQRESTVSNVRTL